MRASGVSERSMGERGKRSPMNWDKYAEIGNVGIKGIGGETAEEERRKPGKTVVW